ncbi:MAG: EndoU domain-containing protein [Cyanobacteria bacterium P01_F01_bin.153]
MGQIWRPQRLLTIATAAIACLMVLTLPVTARGASCNGLSTWSRFSSGPQVNQAHVFCGEFSNNRPKGFHSRPGGRNPNTVANLQITQNPNRQGIYGIRWSHTNNPQRTKFSTMFPDNCSTGQVLNSVRYAAGNRYQCPASAPSWSWCGPSAPASGGDYCRGNNGDRFTVAGAFTRRNDVNTAFPLR